MPLTLTTISYRGRPPADHTIVVLIQRTGSIGRAPDNDMVLPDPEKIISRFHASIHYDNGSFYLTDNSLAGTIIINRGITLHKHTPNETTLLENGDHIQIGDYELTVTVSEEHQFAPPKPLGDVVCEHLSPFSPLEPDNSHDNLDLESLLDSGKSSSPYIPGESGDNQSPSPNTVDFLRGPAHQESFAPPEMVPSPPSTSNQDSIPDDFNLQDLLNSLEEPSDHHQPTDFPNIPPPTIENIQQKPSSPPPQEPSQWAAPEIPAEVHTEPPAMEPAPPAPEESTLVTQSSPVEAVVPPVRPPIVEQQDPPSPVTPSAVEISRQRAQEEMTALFFEAAGISTHASMQPEEMAELMQIAGTLVREMTSGLMTMLRGRMEIKNQFRVSRTILRTTGNNPLKFSLTPEDAIKLLLIEKKPGFLHAVEAVQQACKDVMNHELASTAANQVSLLAILKQFDPHNFSQQYEEGFVLQKKSKCWESYCLSYPELVKKAQENFFGEEFANAYEEQMQKLQSMNSANQQKLRDQSHE